MFWAAPAWEKVKSANEVGFKIGDLGVSSVTAECHERTKLCVPCRLCVSQGLWADELCESCSIDKRPLYKVQENPVELISTGFFCFQIVWQNVAPSTSNKVSLVPRTKGLCFPSLSELRSETQSRRWYLVVSCFLEPCSRDCNTKGFPHVRVGHC